MKTLSRLTLVLALAVAVLVTMSSAAFGAPRLVYSDEFNGPLNTAVWANHTPWDTHYTTGELEYYDPANCTFANGFMTLKSENRANSGYAYSSGIVTSLARAKFSYGYFEIRAKLPKGPGIWPAFWLTNDSTLEIDALEMLGDRPNRIYMTLHKNGSQVQGVAKDGPDYSAGLHTYGVDWQPTYVKWYIDGELCATYNGAMPADPMWICLNTAVGGAWPGSPTAATAFPVDYDIDYIRVYDTKPAVATVAPPVVVDPAAVPVYRFYNKKNGSHFYTASESEKNDVAATMPSTYSLDGVAYKLDTTDPDNDTPLYRFYNKKSGSHFYTDSESEKNTVIATLGATYSFEGVAYGVCATPVAGATAVYRFYNKKNGSHFYTASESEKNSVVASLAGTYSLDGVAFYLAP